MPPPRNNTPNGSKNDAIDVSRYNSNIPTSTTATSNNDQEEANETTSTTSDQRSDSSRKRDASHPLSSCVPRAQSARMISPSEFHHSSSMGELSLLSQSDPKRASSTSSRSVMTMTMPSSTTQTPVSTSASTANASWPSTTSSVHCIGSDSSRKAGRSNSAFSCQQQHHQTQHHPYNYYPSRPMTPANRTYSCPSFFANTNVFDLGDGSRRSISNPEELHLLHSAIIDYDEQLNQEVDELFNF